jgi:mRNA interferase MazF
MNKFISTVIIAPMTTKSKSYPTRVDLTFQSKKGFIVLDQIRTVDKSRLIKKLGSTDIKTITKIKKIIKEMLVD